MANIPLLPLRGTLREKPNEIGDHPPADNSDVNWKFEGSPSPDSRYKLFTIADGYFSRKAHVDQFLTAWESAPVSFTPKVFDVLPGSLQAVAEQRQQALASVDEWRKRLDAWHGGVINSTRNSFDLSLKTAGHIWKTGGKASDKNYTWIPNVYTNGASPSVYLSSKVESFFNTALLAAQAERNRVNAFYNDLENKVQNDLLDKIVKIHPELKWRTEPFAASNVKEIAEIMLTKYNPAALWINDPWDPEYFKDAFTFEEEWPNGRDASNGVIASLAATKINWMFTLISEGLSQLSNPELLDGPFAAHMIGALKSLMAKGLIERAEKEGYGEAFIKGDARIVEALKYSSQAFDQAYATEEYKKFMYEMVEKGQIGKSARRGGLIMCPWGTEHHCRGAGSKVRTISSFIKLPSHQEGEKYFRASLAALPQMLAFAAEGGWVVGCPGPLLMSSYVSTFKNYAFNVAILSKSGDEVAAAVRSRCAHPQNDIEKGFVRSTSQDRLQGYWVNTWKQLMDGDKRKKLMGDYGLSLINSFEGVLTMETSL